MLSYVIAYYAFPNHLTFCFSYVHSNSMYVYEHYVVPLQHQIPYTNEPFTKYIHFSGT